MHSDLGTAPFLHAEFAPDIAARKALFVEVIFPHQIKQHLIPGLGYEHKLPQFLLYLTVRAVLVRAVGSHFLFDLFKRQNFLIHKEKKRDFSRPIVQNIGVNIETAAGPPSSCLPLYVQTVSFDRL